MRTIAFLFTVILFAAACRQGTTAEHADVQSQEWPQLDTFHLVMAESFHPYADSGNLEPARQYAAEMASLSAAWAQEALPGKVDNETVRRLLNDLSQETAALEAMAPTAPDDSLGAALTSVHDLFHKIQDAWYRPVGEEQEHHQMQ